MECIFLTNARKKQREKACVEHCQGWIKIDKNICKMRTHAVLEKEFVPVFFNEGALGCFLFLLIFAFALWHVR